MKNVLNSRALLTLSIVAKAAFQPLTPDQIETNEYNFSNVEDVDDETVNEGVGESAPTFQDTISNLDAETQTLLLELYDAGFRNENLRVAWALVQRESRGKSDAVCHNRNGTKDRGIFQINDVHHKQFRIRNPKRLHNNKFNAKVAFQISKNGTDFSAWAIPNPDGSVTGYAYNLRKKSPRTYKKYNKHFKKFYKNYPLKFGEVK